MPKIPKRAHSGFFKTGVLYPENNRQIKLVRLQKKCQPNCNKVHWNAL
jgi:hypothetical protein